jgi:hypothetical protein
VLGIGVCLSGVGFDALGLEGLGLQPAQSAYRLIYTEDPLKLDRLRMFNRSTLPERRQYRPGSLISLTQPEEAFTTFPIDAQTANRCRLAWKSGAVAAKYVQLAVKIPDSAEWLTNPNYHFLASDLDYKIVVRGEPVGRLTDEVCKLAEYSLGMNCEFCGSLQSIIDTLPPEAVTWVIEYLGQQTIFSEGFDSQDMVLSPTQIEALCVTQAFLMGYYYGVFLPLVDTSSLRVQVVNGCWGYRYVSLLAELRTGEATFLGTSSKMSGSKTLSAKGVISRANVLVFLAKLFFGGK